MKRLLILSMMSLAVAGCAQSKGALSRGASYPPSPVAVTPVPSVYDTINAGVGGDALAQTTLRNAKDPRWAGRAPVPTAPGSVPTNKPSAATAVAAAAPSGAPANAGPVGAAPDPVEMPGAPPAMAAAGVMPPPGTATEMPATAPLGAGEGATLPPLAQQVSSAAPTSPEMAGPAVPVFTGPSSSGPAPSRAPDQSPAVAGMIRSPAAMAAPGAEIGPDPAVDIVSAPGAGPAAAPVAAADPTLPTSANPSPVPVAVSATPIAAPVAAAAATPIASPSAARAGRGADPLLGPNPDLMPPMPELPPSGSATTKPNGSVATPPPIEAAPAATAPGQPGAPAGIDPPIQLERSSAASKPANAGLAAAGLPSEPASADVSVAARASDVRRDSQIILASAEKSKVPSKTRPHSPKNAGLPAARVGDEVITFRDLNSAVAELKSRYGIPQINGFDSVQEMQLRQFEARLRNEALNTLIDQSLLVQEAKHHLKDKKMLEKAYDAADGIFHDNEVVPLERKYNVDNERQLKEKLAEEGKSLDAMRTAFRRYFLAHNYLHEKIKDRLNVELPDLLKYYNDHVYEHEFDRPAQITWREIVVEADQHKTREEAQKKALALLEKLGHGADFAALAKNESEGPTSSRNKGGLMETAPGSYVVKQINDALDKLPLGQHSGIIEGPNSFHIIKVEKRRPAGPASFEEVQDKIKPKLVDQKRQEESTAFLAKITRDALIVKFTGENAPLADAH